MRNWIAAGVVMVAVSATGCERQPDVEDMAEGALQSVALDEKVNAEFDEAAGVVRLSGTVDSADQRSRAADAVRASIGAHAQVANEIVVEGAHEKAADDLDGGIEERFETLMEETKDLDGRDVDLRVENGVVTLSGAVRTDAERTKVEGLARSIPGVNQVINGITVERDRARPDTRK